MYFPTYALRKAPLDNCLKSPASEDPSTSNMVNGSKQCRNLNGSAFIPNLLITAKKIYPESDMQNLKAVC